MRLGTSRNGAVAAYLGLFDVQRKSLQTLRITEKEVLLRQGDELILLFSIMVDLSLKHESMAREMYSVMSDEKTFPRNSLAICTLRRQSIRHRMDHHSIRIRVLTRQEHL